MTVTVSGTTSTVTADVDAAAGNQTALTFTATDWATAQPVTVTAGEDDNSGGETVTLTHGVAGADYGGVTVGSVTVRVTDNDTPALVIDANPSAPGVDAGPLALKELSTDPAHRQVYTVKLATQPSGDVHVRVRPPDAVTVDVAAAAGNQETLTFSPVTWALAQPVTVTAAQDAAAGDETAALTHAGSGHEYGLVTQTLTVTVADDETPGVTLSVAGSDLTVTENGQVTYTVRLDTEPVRGAVTIRPRLLSGGDPHLSLVPAAPVLTFTASTWRTAQAVTVRAADDPDPDAGTATLSHTVSGADYGGVTVPDVTVTEADDDAPGIRITPTELAVEEGTTGTYTVELHTPPTGAVTVTVTHTGGSPDVAVDADATPTTRTLVFTPGNWHVAQPVTVTAKDDDDGTDEEPTTLTHAVSSSDADYQSLPNVTVTVRVTDDDEPGVTVSAAGSDLTVAEGSQETYTVVLATLPTEAVTVTVTRMAERNPDAVTVGPDTTPASRTLVFTTGDWNVAQTVTVSTAEDAEDYRDETATLTPAQAYTLTATDMLDGETASIEITITVKPGIQSRDLGLVLAGVGRTLATDAVEILGNRFGAPASRLQVTLGGQVLRLTAPASAAPPSPSPPAPSPSAPPPSPLEGEGRGEGSLLQGAGSPLPDEAPVGSRLTRPSVLQGAGSTPAPAAGPSPWQQATGVALGVARALGVTLELPTAGNSPAPSSPSPLVGEGRGEGSLLQGQGNLPGRGPADLRRGTSTANLLRIQPVSAKDLLARSSFELPLTRTGEDGVPAWTLWGRGSASGFSGQPEAGFTMAGTLTSGYVGVDYRPRSAMLLGLAVAHSTGEVSYERTEATKAGLDVEMTSLLPYAHWQVRPGLGVWGLAGLGWGQMALKLDGDPQTYTTGLTSWLGAVGGRQALTTWQGIDLAAKTDAFVTTVRSAGQTNLDAARGQAQRVRLVLEGQTAVVVSPVSRLEPRLELGGRWDSGTAEQGLGAELGGGVTYVRTDWGLSVAGQGRYLLVHEDGAFEDWGASVAVRVDPGLAGQGLTLTVAPVWGQATSGVEQVWGTAPGVPGGRDAAPAGWRPGRVELDVGYGVALAQGVVTPYSGVSLGAPGAARYRLGSHWTGAGLDVTVEGDRTEQPGQAPAHRVSVRLGWQW